MLVYKRIFVYIATLMIMSLLVIACGSEETQANNSEIVTYKRETISLKDWTLAYITPAEGTSIEPIGVNVKNIEGSALITPIDGDGTVYLYPTNTKTNVIRLVRAGTDDCPNWVIEFVPFDSCEVIEQPVPGEKIP